MRVDTLPVSLQRLLQNTSWQLDTLGMSSAETYRIVGKENFYLKITPADRWNSLQKEAKALTWLRAYLPAPEVIFFERIDETDYLLMRELPGLPASDDHWKANPHQLVKILAESMLALHNLDSATCPFDQRTDAKLREVAQYVQLGFVDVDDFEPENSEQSSQQILDRLYAEQPVQDDLVVTHGDFCLPNIVLDNGQLGGFIDVSSLGVGDRYQDLALCARSLVQNLGTDQYNALFFDRYGLTNPDEHKLRYFRLLDELK
ncbi:APH(3') family aminoglycoside O-phosphotransferase [Spirosoma sp.]|uniref:APH(3') family aminoglycoside O-phosphotransferase n=1 Tax=Spirosoma sp. TaxID=1899569 RepID=UPI003B3A2EAB